MMNVLMMTVTEREAKPRYYRHAGLAHNVNLLRKMSCTVKPVHVAVPRVGPVLFLYF